MNLEVGKNYFVRTVTDHWLGELVSIDGPHDITLCKASWVSDTGRLADFMRDGKTAEMEIEPLPDGILHRVHWYGISDWPHPLLREQH